jgi:hypothetical protein
LILRQAFVKEGSGPHAPGATVTLVQTVRNTGVLIPASTAVRLSDRLPAGASTTVGDIVVIGARADCTVTLPDVVCDIRDGLGIGQEVTLEVAVRLPDRIPGGGVVIVQKAVDPQNTIAENDENNNKAKVSIPMQ